MSELLQRQLLFGKLLPGLIQRAHEIGCRVKVGEVSRAPIQAALNSTSQSQRIHLAALIAPDFPALARTILDLKGSPGVSRSVHVENLAVDLMLFRGETWLRDGDEYATLGAHWTGLHPLARWGGDFSRPDPGHFSITPDGVRA